MTRVMVVEDEPLVREVWDREELRALWLKQGETFKAEWLGELPADAEITIYRSGKWMDLCRGPHLASTGKLDPQAFKLTRVSGAYWRGDEHNPQLTRIYGTAWATDADLEAYLVKVEEAEKRDHRKLGTDLDLFSFPEEVGGGGTGAVMSSGTSMRRERSHSASPLAWGSQR